MPMCERMVWLEKKSLLAVSLLQVAREVQIQLVFSLGKLQLLQLAEKKRHTVRRIVETAS